MHSSEYKEITTYKKVMERRKIKQEMEQLVKEQVFYLNIIAHHAGM